MSLKNRSEFVLIIFYLQLINSGHADSSMADKKHRGCRGLLGRVIKKQSEIKQKHVTYDNQTRKKLSDVCSD